MELDVSTREVAGWPNGNGFKPKADWTPLGKPEIEKLTVKLLFPAELKLNPTIVDAPPPWANDNSGLFNVTVKLAS